MNAVPGRESGWRDKSWVALSVFAGLVAGVGTLAVAAAGFSLSFDASKSVAVAAHIRPGWAWMLPVSVDGAMAVAAVVAVVMRHLKGETARYPWMVVALGAMISIACNGLHAIGDGTELDLTSGQRIAVSAIPPLMLALSVHLLVMLIELVGEVVRSKSTPASTPAGTQNAAPPLPPPSSLDDEAAGRPGIGSPIDSRIGLGEPADRVESIGVEGRSDRAESTRSDARSSGAQSTRSPGRSRPRRSGGRSAPRDRSDRRKELDRAIDLGFVDRGNPTAESIRVALQCSPGLARDFREELKAAAAAGEGGSDA